MFESTSEQLKIYYARFENYVYNLKKDFTPRHRVIFILESGKPGEKIKLNLVWRSGVRTAAP